MAKTLLSERIRQLRKARAWSQEHLANVASIASRTLQRIENGKPAAAKRVLPHRE